MHLSVQNILQQLYEEIHLTIDVSDFAPVSYMRR